MMRYLLSEEGEKCGRPGRGGGSRDGGGGIDGRDATFLFRQNLREKNSVPIPRKTLFLHFSLLGLATFVHADGLWQLWTRVFHLSHGILWDLARPEIYPPILPSSCVPHQKSALPSRLLISTPLLLLPPSFFSNSSSVFQERRGGFDLLLSLAPGCGCVPSCPDLFFLSHFFLLRTHFGLPPTFTHSVFSITFFTPPSSSSFFTPHALLIPPWVFFFCCT